MQPRDPETIPPGGEADELTRGAAPYLEVLARIHRVLAPRTYLEIGVRRGASLALAECPSVGVDPVPEPNRPLPPEVEIVAEPSDEYFRRRGPSHWQPDLVFIDGMHLFENALRDFMNVERISGADTLVAVDDIYPNAPRQAARARSTRVWTGDVWKLHVCLQRHRPDLWLLALDTSPAGMLLIAGCDARSRVLPDAYERLVRTSVAGEEVEVPAGRLAREGALDPRDPVLENVLATLRGLRGSGVAPGEVKRSLDRATQGRSR